MTDTVTLGACRTQILASMTTPCMIAQTLDMEVRPENELLLNETMHTIALQRQVKQNFAAGRFENDSGPYRYADIGRLMFVPSKIPLRIKFEGEQVSIARCMFPVSTFADLFAHEKGLIKSKTMSILNIRSSSIRGLVIRIASEIENQLDDAEEIVTYLGHILVIELKRYFDSRYAADGVSRGGLSRAAWRKAIQRIEADALPPTLDELAQLTGLSKRHLTRAFRQSTGQTVQEKVNEARFNRAINELSNSSITIDQLALKSGFCSASTFSNAFKKWTGKTPGRYRNSQ